MLSIKQNLFPTRFDDGVLNSSFFFGKSHNNRGAAIFSSTTALGVWRWKVLAYLHFRTLAAGGWKDARKRIDHL